MSTPKPTFASSIVAALNSPAGNTVMITLIIALLAKLGVDVAAPAPVVDCPVVAPVASPPVVEPVAVPVEPVAVPVIVPAADPSEPVVPVIEAVKE